MKLSIFGTFLILTFLCVSIHLVRGEEGSDEEGCLKDGAMDDLEQSKENII